MKDKQPYTDKLNTLLSKSIALGGEFFELRITHKLYKTLSKELIPSQDENFKVLGGVVLPSGMFNVKVDRWGLDLKDLE